jgi:LPS-assembly protein
LALTSYNLQQLSEFNQQQSSNNQTRATINRSLPIFDVLTGMSFERKTSLFGRQFQQTLEPQLYYTYIPNRKQSTIPVFDTAVNTLTYDQLFNYNRFTGIDRIGDANQIGIGITTRFIDAYSGFEKVRFGLGDIIYFANRRVTLCNDDSCSDNPKNPNNREKLSPISGLFNYHITRTWSFNTSAIWNPISKQLDNTTLAFQYQPDALRLINLGYTYARSGDILSGISTTNSVNNLKVTDISIAWPISPHVRAVGRWSQNWNRQHLQNLIYGIQYDTCCWAVQLVGGRTFTSFDTNNNNTPRYNTEVSIQFSLKGLGEIGTGNPASMLNGIPGYQTQ